MVFKKKMQTIPLDKYFEIKRNEYVTVQIIPTKSNKNNSTEAIASLVNTMFKQLNKLVRIENKKLIVETQMKASYYIHITKEEVKFFFILPKIHLMKFKSKFSETWRNVEIKEVDRIPININECTKYQLRYKMNDALSLNVDKRNNCLLNANMSVLEILESDESVGIFYNFIPTSEKESNYFKTTYKTAIDKYKNGENLKKSKNIIDLGVITLKFLITFLDDLVNSILSDSKNSSNVFISTEKEISPSTRRKAKSDICKTQVVVVSKSNRKEREKQLAISTCNTFQSLSDNNEDNELVYKEIKSNIKENAIVLPGVESLKTTVEECGNFISIPGKEIIEQYKNIEHKTIKENPVPEELKKGVCYLGPVIYKGLEDRVFLNNSESLNCLPHVIMGGSRSGKSTLSINICKNIIDAGEGLIVPDFIKNTEFADNIASITPPDRLIDIDLSKYEWVQALAINELQITEDMGFDEIVKISRRKTSNFLELINIMNNDDKQLAPKMRKYLGASARIAFCFNNSSAKDIIRILQNHIIRHEYIGRLSCDLKDKLEDSIINLLELDEWSAEKKDKPSQLIGTKENKIEGIIDRIDLFRENDVIDTMFSKSPEGNVDFVDAMEKKKVIIIRMRDCDFDDMTSKDVLMTFFMQKIWQATKIRGAMHLLPPRVTLLVDEIFQVPTCQKILEKTFLQSAKFGLKYMFTLHNLEGLSKEALASLKGANTTYTLISGVDKKAYEALEEEFGVHGYCLDDMLNLEQYTALHLIKNKDGYDALITRLPPKLKVTENIIQNIA